MKTICASALIFALLPAASATGVPISTDLVIHKMQVESGTDLSPSTGLELGNLTGTNLEGATPLAGVIFKYWTISPSATPSQMSEIKGLMTIADINTYIAANPTLLTGATQLSATDASGVVRVNGLDEGLYLFAETNGADLNISEYIGVPFLLELPAMKTDGSGYFGTGADALHVYPKNVKKSAGLDVKTVNESGAQIGGALFRVQQLVGGVYQDVTSVGTGGVITLSTGFITLADLPAGQYQLVNTIAPPGYMSDERPVKFTVSSGDVTFDDPNSPMATFTPATSTDNPLITVKYNKKPSLEKTEGSGGTEQVGEEVIWTVAADVPTGIVDYQVFTLIDTIDTRLDFLGLTEVTVTVDDVPLVSGTDYTLSYDTGTREFSVVFVPTQLVGYVGKKVVVTYKTAINETALMGEEIPNHVTLDFDNGHGAISDPGDPNNPPIEPEQPPSVWTGGAQFKKIDGSNQTAVLPGAQFKIAKDAAGTIFLQWTQGLLDANTASKFVTPEVGQDIVMKSGDDGIFEIKGLKGGTYYLVEIKAPNVSGTQYNLLREPTAFMITKTSYEVTSLMNIENRSGLHLPQTGGIGTVLFTLVGVGLMTFAIILFKKRKEKEGLTPAE